MDITKEILKRATVQGFAEYLLYGSAIEGKRNETNYNKKLEKAYNEQEEILRIHNSKSVSELVDASNNMASEVAEVYTAIGLQAGLMIAYELFKHIRK